MTSHSSALLHLLQQQVAMARAKDDATRAQYQEGARIQVPGTGKAISTAYEQLRNAAEYTEEHLLLQRAIRRFYKRNLSFVAKPKIGAIGEELIVELTQAGYLLNSTFSQETAAVITGYAKTYMNAYWQMRDARVSREKASDWTLAVLAVDTEELLNPHSHLGALAQTAYQHYLLQFPRDTFTTSKTEEERYELCLYIAVHQALLKSDIGVVRHDLLRMYKQTPHDIPGYIHFNKMTTELYNARLTQRLRRAVSRHGAPFRVLKSMIEDRTDFPDLLQDREAFLTVYDRQVSTEYKSIKRRLNKGIIKSIIFVFITKVIIGIGIEIPYDLLVHHSVALLPLGINLLFPPLYMASLRLGLKVPSAANAQALRDYIDRALFSEGAAVPLSLRDARTRTSWLARVLYSILFLVPFAVTVYVLFLLQFNAVQAVIFFVFLSTASFLGFRLSHLVRELEIVTKQQGLLSSIRDFFYLPFIVVGQWLSSKYAKVNAVAYVLDIVIELPLKTVLRLLRQWTRFLNEKHDEIY